MRTAVRAALCALALPLLVSADDAAPPPPTELQELRTRVARLEQWRDLESRLKNADAEQVLAETGRQRGLLGPVLVGPNVTLLQLPTGPTLGLEVKGHGLWGLDFDYGFIPATTISKAKIAFSMWRVGAKVYPFRGAFFLGAHLGSYKLTGESQQTGLDGATLKTKVEVSSPFVAPVLGWRWVRPSGFFTGFDLSWQFATGYKSKSSPVEPSGTLEDIQKNADKYLKNGLPSLGLARMGWFF
ncbi:MAG: hypothetical protein ACJ79R_00290 [Anaeromyxobacteraceae bacterium]